MNKRLKMHVPCSVLFALVAASCVPLAERGDEGQQCFANGTCLPGLVCVGGSVCVQDTGGTLFDAGGDAHSVDGWSDVVNGPETGPDTTAHDASGDVAEDALDGAVGPDDEGGDPYSIEGDGSRGDNGFADVGLDAGADGGRLDAGIDGGEDTGTDAGVCDPAGTGEEEWLDSTSGLGWQEPAPDLALPWQDAKNYCNNLSWACHSDWRLPTINELRSVIRGCAKTQTGGACGVTDSCPFSVTACWSMADCADCAQWGGPGKNGCYWDSSMDGFCGIYWTSTTHANNGAMAIHVQFAFGSISYSSKTENGTRFVRCVRGP
ncbi:MAG: DUF1566 domain-containing protein [Deltaproteobacteria bacterium]|nr:DUF1566 domain-containing protein [Deltaproteobacteria bacterium]